MKRRVLGAAVTLAATTTIVVLPATEAFAASSNCNIQPGAKSCRTNAVTHYKNAILLTAFGPSTLGHSVTCWAKDADTNVSVGQVKAVSWTSNSKEIGGLYGSYYAYCERSSTSASGGGGRVDNGQ